MSKTFGMVYVWQKKRDISKFVDPGSNSCNEREGNKQTWNGSTRKRIYTLIKNQICGLTLQATTFLTI